MKSVTLRHALLLAVALAAATLITATLTGCADVHQNPASSVVMEQAATEQVAAADALASQAADAQSPTNVPF